MEEAVMNKHELIIIGGSAGSITALMRLLPVLAPHMHLPMILVLHRKENEESILAEVLANKTHKTVKEIEEKETIQPDTIYLAPADYHLLLEKNRTFSLDFSEKVNYSRPSIDVSFESAADVYGSSLIGILLSGANADGAAGLEKIKAAGGITIAQDPNDAEVGYMPEQAIIRSNVDFVFNTGAIGSFLNSLPNR